MMDKNMFSVGIQNGMKTWCKQMAVHLKCDERHLNLVRLEPQCLGKRAASSVWMVGRVYLANSITVATLPVGSRKQIGLPTGRTAWTKM